MAGSEWRNSVVVVFMGRNGMHGRVHREGLDGTVDGNKAWCTAEWRKRPCVRLATVETGSCSSGGVWRTAKRRKRTSYGRNGGPVDREECGVPQNGGNRLVLEHYGRNGGPIDWEGCGILQNGTLQDTVHLHRRPPPTSTYDCSSTASCSSSLHRSSTSYCSTNLLHGVLFNQPSTGSSCPSSPPWGHVHPPPTALIDRGPVHPAATTSTTTGYYSSNPPPGTVHPIPTPTTLTVH